jgi:hypothetical protein
MSLYPDIDPAKLPVGKVICIPEAQPYQDGFAKYKIKRGDTFFSISKENSNVMEQIISLLPDVDAVNLPVGKSICVPASLVQEEKRVKHKIQTFTIVKPTRKHKVIKVVEVEEDDDQTTTTTQEAIENDEQIQE